MNISTEFTIVYELIVIVSFIGILFSFIWTLRNKKKWGYVIAPLFLFINIFLYTMALKFEMLTHRENELWEGIIMLHSLFLSIVMLSAMPPSTSLLFRQKKIK